MHFIIFNGKVIPADEPALVVANKSYRYGDGLFETMKIFRGAILFEKLHFDRLEKGVAAVKIKLPVLLRREKLADEIKTICKKNKCEELARVRLSVFRGNGGLYDENNDAGYVIECWPLEQTMNELNENGLVTGIFPDGRKSQDNFANLKSSSFLVYSMAAQYARENKLNDCFVLNTKGNIADSTIANVFIIKNGGIVTPALSEGCVAGVMRHYLIQSLLSNGWLVEEKVVSPDDLLQADELFLTNAIRGIRWVRVFGESTYGCEKTVEIYKQFIQTIFH